MKSDRKSGSFEWVEAGFDQRFHQGLSMPSRSFSVESQRSLECNERIAAYRDSSR